jgi:hypothetical protein
VDLYLSSWTALLWTLESAWSILLYLDSWVFKLLETLDLPGVSFLTCYQYPSLLLKTAFPRGQSWCCEELPSFCDQLWAYTYTQSTRWASSRKPRGDPAENPAEHQGGTCRPSGPQGLDVRHRAPLSQPCTTSADAGGAIRTLVPVTSPPRPPPERANVPTYDPWGK